MTRQPSFGVATREQIEGLSGLQFLQRIIDGELPGPPIAEVMGFRLAEAQPGRVVFEADPSPALLNPLGSIHGGWALTLIDSAAGCALHSDLPPDTGYSTVETKANFTRPISPNGGTVRCEGVLISKGRQIATAEARLLSSEGKLLAHGTSTLIILPRRD